MPKKHRLSRADFVRLEKMQSRRLHGRYFSLAVAPLSGGGPKMASVVSKKIAARSVDRNRIDRQCREALRPHMNNIQDPVALIFRAKREAASATPSDLRKDIEVLVSRASLA